MSFAKIKPISYAIASASTTPNGAGVEPGGGGGERGQLPPLLLLKSPLDYSIQVSFLNALPNIGKKIQKDKMSCCRKTILTYKNKKGKSCIDHPLTIVLLIFAFKLLYCPNLQLITIYDTLLFNSIFLCYPSSYFLLYYLMSQYGIEILKPPLSIFSPS